jgi:tellurite resistance-related uncharacterized protein
MKQLPENALAYSKTAIFNQNTIPNGLLNQHTTKAGTWGKINVISGKLVYKILSKPSETHILTPTFSGIVEPQIPHQVESIEAVEFYVEFYQIPED